MDKYSEYMEDENEEWVTTEVGEEEQPSDWKVRFFETPHNLCLTILLLLIIFSYLITYFLVGLLNKIGKVLGFSIKKR